MNKFDMIISYGPEAGDCTRPYYITLKRKDITVEEFIKFILTDSDWEREWGYFDIFTNKKQMPFRPKYALSYSKGEAKGTSVIPNKIMQSTIKQISGSGGWTRSDFDILIEGDTKMENNNHEHNQENMADKELINALKTEINSIYGLTADHSSSWIANVQKRVSDRRKEVAKCVGALNEDQMFRVDIVVRVPGENATAEHIKELIDEAFTSFVSGKATTNNKEE